jgi:hypothetical protein
MTPPLFHWPSPRAARRALAAAATAVAVLAPAPVSATGAGIQPANVEVVAAPGSTVRKVVKVGNLRTDRAQKFIVGLAEWDLDDAGALKLRPPGSDPSTARVRYMPAQFTLGPGEGQNILVEIEVPARVAQARESRIALLVTNPLPSAEALKGRKAIVNQFQLASLFYITDPGLAPKPLVESVAWDAADPAAPAVHARVANQGSAHARFIAVTEIADGEGKLVHQAESSAVVMEGRTRDWVNRLKVPDLAPGRYDVTWKVYSAFDPKRPDERAGVLLETKEWPWERSAAPPKPSPR